MMRFKRPCALYLTLLLFFGLSSPLAHADGPVDDSGPVDDNRQRLETMSDVEKTALVQKKRRFEEMSPAKQDRMRRLHKELTSDSDCERLRKVLERYNNWLKILTPIERAEIIGLPAEERIAKIREMLRRQQASNFRTMVGGMDRRFGKLSPEDLKAINQWLDRFTEEHEAEILAALPDKRYGQFKKNYDPAKHRPFLAVRALSQRDVELPRPTAEDQTHLIETLSDDAKNHLDEESDPDRQSWILRRWIMAAAFSRLRPSPEELEKFVAEKLDVRQREALLNLPREKMYAEMHRSYLLKVILPMIDSGERKPWGAGWRGGGRRSRDGKRGPERGPESGRPQFRGPGGPEAGPGRKPGPWDPSRQPPLDRDGTLKGKLDKPADTRGRSGSSPNSDGRRAP